MINCFPQLYEDELLYSAVSRYRRQCGLVNKESISRDFIFKTNKIFQMFFPLRLAKIAETLPATSKITAEYLLYNHTMYPFYTKLLPEKIKNKIKNDIISKDNINIISSLGSGNIIRQGNYLKYCPQCLKEDIDNLGESYWRREHQVVGILFCSRHKIQLQESNVLCNSINREYICLDDIKMKDMNTQYTCYKEFNLKYIDLMHELIEINNQSITLMQIKRFYRDKLNDKGLTTNSGKIHIKKLAYALNEYYGQEYLKIMQSGIKDYDNNWIMNFFNKDNNKPIIRHLLLLQFLKCSAKDIFEQKKERKYLTEYKAYNPKLDIEERKKIWLDIIRENPNKSRNQLIKINPKVYSYLYKYARDWYNEVTPRYKKEKGIIFNWSEKDERTLKEVKIALNTILSMKSQPIKICNASIRREMGLSEGRFNKKLIQTVSYINKVTESNEEYWIRKIKWAIKQLQNEDIPLTLYKIQIKSGFGNDSDGSKRKLIMDVLSNSDA
ncbi:TnsD family Tn7-like transposition protein [Clostridium butyricum]|uniref:TnsD family Tn7-like transposition protein n=1 Tax=Clostridium butyricum TaxID=1492 RepID=UPI002AB1AFAE|nr:TnsD family Tn7-like transposition protein [Clostridium butyricum]